MKRIPAALLVLLASTATLAGPAPDLAASRGPVPPPPVQGGAGAAAPRVPFVPDVPILAYTVVQNPLPLPAGMTYGVVASIGINSKGRAFVYQRTPVPILEFDAKGTFVRGMREGTDTRAHSIRIDSADNMWIVDAGDHTVTKLDPQGNVLMTLGTKGVTGAGDEAASKQLFNIPSDIAVAPNGDLFIAQGEGAGPDPRVIRFDRNGKFIATWSLAYAAGVRSHPHAIDVDRNGLIYVADREVMRIRVFRPDGRPIRDIQLQNLAYGIFIDRNQQVWIATGTDGIVLKLDLDGRILGKMGSLGPGAGQIGEGHMIAATPAGEIYVADVANRAIHKFVQRR